MLSKVTLAVSKVRHLPPLRYGHDVVKFGKDPISYHVETTLLSKIIFIVPVTLTFDPKLNRVLPLPQGNHVAKFGKDPIYRTKVNARKPVRTPVRPPAIPNHIIRPVSRRAYKNHKGGISNVKLSYNTFSK